VSQHYNQFMKGSCSGGFDVEQWGRNTISPSVTAVGAVTQPREAREVRKPTDPRYGSHNRMSPEFHFNYQLWNSVEVRAQPVMSI
jgi:hypothetical protein